MEGSSVIGVILFFIIFLFSYKGFRDTRFFEAYEFHVDAILIGKQFKRMLSSGFLHVGWWHLLLNLLVLLSFSAALEIYMGVGFLLLIYFASLLGGNFLALYIHRNHGDYRAVGASGAISGIVLAAVLNDPNGAISFLLIPIEFKAWGFAAVYMLFTIFGIKSQKGNIGHSAHLGGAITGALLTLLLNPSLISTYPWLIAAILLPAIAFLILVIINPKVLILPGYWGDNAEVLKDKFKRPAKKPKKEPRKELDDLLKKIKDKGMDSLTAEEKRRLDELSRKL